MYDMTKVPAHKHLNRIDGRQRSVRRSFLPLPCPHCGLLVLEVQVLHPQSEGLRKAKASSIQQVTHEAVRAFHVPEHGFYFRLSGHNWKAIRLLGPLKVGDLFPLGPEHIAIEKQKGI